MIARLAGVSLGVVALALVTAGPAFAQNKCAGDKIKAAAKKTTCKATLEEKQAGKGATIDPAKVAKCEATFSKGFAKAESKGNCLTTGDAGTIEAKVDAFVGDLDTELDVGTGTNPNPCEGAKIKAAAKKANCKAQLEAKQASKGGTIDPAKVAKCEASFSKSFAKAEAKGGCNTTGDAATIEAKVDAFVDDADLELTPTTSTTTVPTTTSTTNTTVPGIQGVLPRTSGLFNFAGVGVAGADTACNSNWPGTDHCNLTELLAAESAGQLLGIKDTNNVTVTSFFVIDSTHADTIQCDAAAVGSQHWQYETAHTGTGGEQVPLNNGTGDLGTPTSGLGICLPPGSWVGCCTP
jgi:hypothetical protein